MHNFTMPLKEGILSVSYCLKSKRFVVKMWTQGEWLCLHRNTISEEQEEIEQFIQSKASAAYIKRSNGRIEKYPIQDFSFIADEGYLEHDKICIAINLFQSISQSYAYYYDDKGEIIDKEPFYDVTIV